MRVVLVTVGTDGDVFPYVGLGSALRSRGHMVELAASAHYEPLARAHGLGFMALVSAEENRELFDHPDFWNPVRTAPLAARWGVRFMERQYRLLAERVTADTVLVANPGVFAARLVHDKFGTPLVTPLLQPGLITSSIAPPMMPCFLWLRRAPRPVWKGFWVALDLLGHFLVGRSLNRLRASLGLKPFGRLFQNWLSPQLVLGLFPEWYGVPQADWPRQIQLTGFPMFDGGQAGELAPAVEEFCRGGTPPVAFTFGTGMAHSAELFRTALEACTALGLRGIFLTKHRDQLPQVLPSSIFHSTFAPFRLLFPLCGAVVNHGGIGTVAEAMAAGTPQLICPQCFDQFDNGVRVQGLGIGDWIKARPGKSSQIAEALKRVMTAEVRSRCRVTASRFEGQDGLGSAADVIEKFTAGKK